MREAAARAGDELALPLADAGVTRADVLAFWRSQPFDLELRPGEGNCDLCFLKGVRLRQNIARARPDLLQWWIEREREIGATFRAHEPAYAELLDQGDLFAETLEAEIETETIPSCYCGED
jgi:hypothetical protein